MVDAIKLIKTLWRDGRATYHAKYLKIENAMLEPKPVQKPHPPIMIGGCGEQLALRAVARYGNLCNVFGDPATVGNGLEILSKHCDKEKRNYAESEKTNNAGFILARDGAGF